MPETITCSGCKSPIDVPDDHKSPMIHCGICWAEVAIPSRAAPPKVIPVAPVVAPAALPARASQSGIRPAPSGIKAAPSGIQPAPSGIQATPRNLSGVRQAEALPAGAKPAKGMAPLEVLISKAATRLKSSSPSTQPSVAPTIPAGTRPRDSQIVMPPAMPTLSSDVIEDIEVTIVDDAPPPVVAVAEVITRKSNPNIPPVEPPPVRRRRNLDEDDEGRSRSRSSDSKSSKYRKREQVDEDDDDDHLRRRQRKTRTSPLIGVIIGGVVTVLLMITGAWYMLSGGSGSTAASGNAANGAVAANGGDAGAARVPDAAANKPLPQLNPPPIDNATPQPNIGQPPPRPRNVLPPFNQDRPFPDPAWMTVSQADGFEAQMLGEARFWDRHTENLHDPGFIYSAGKGKTYRSNGPWYGFEIRIADAPKGVQPNLQKILAFPFFREDQIKPVSFAGQQGYEVISSDNTKTEIRRIAQVGCRVFLFKVELRSIFGRTQEDIDSAKSKFLDSIKFTFDATTPAPIDPNLRRR